MRPGRGFGMILDAEDRGLAMAHALHGAIVEIDVRDLHIGREGIRVHGEAVILSRDGHFARAEVLHRLIAAMMPELELEGLPAVGVTENLVPEANAKNGDAAKQVAGGLMGIMEGGGIAGAIAEKDAVRFHREHVLRPKWRRGRP